MELRLFYNPIWMPSEEDIRIWCFEVSVHAVINSYEGFEPYVRSHYRGLARKAYEEHGKEIYKWYHEFIDENYWYNDPDTLIDCLLASDKYSIQEINLRERIEQNEMPEYIIGSSEAQDISAGTMLNDLFYFFNYMAQ
jgi:hypothetical protein